MGFHYCDSKCLLENISSLLIVLWLLVGGFMLIEAEHYGNSTLETGAFFAVLKCNHDVSSALTNIALAAFGVVRGAQSCRLVVHYFNSGSHATTTHNLIRERQWNEWTLKRLQEFFARPVIEFENVSMDLGTFTSDEHGDSAYHKILAPSVAKQRSDAFLRGYARTLHSVFDSLDFTLELGRIFFITGEHALETRTLARMLALVDVPSGGKIRLGQHLRSRFFHN